MYAPTNDKPNDGIEVFYSTLEETMTLTNQGEITIIPSDFNAKIGKGNEGERSCWKIWFW